MPVKRCQKDGKSGFKYGDSGKCYTGKGARAKAEKQGRAIEASKHGTNNQILRLFPSLFRADTGTIGRPE